MTEFNNDYEIVLVIKNYQELQIKCKQALKLKELIEKKIKILHKEQCGCKEWNGKEIFGYELK